MATFFSDYGYLTTLYFESDYSDIVSYSRPVLSAFVDWTEKEEKKYAFHAVGIDGNDIDFPIQPKPDEFNSKLLYKNYESLIAQDIQEEGRQVLNDSNIFVSKEGNPVFIAASNQIEQYVYEIQQNAIYRDAPSIYFNSYLKKIMGDTSTDGEPYYAILSEIGTMSFIYEEEDLNLSSSSSTQELTTSSSQSSLTSSSTQIKTSSSTELVQSSSSVSIAQTLYWHNFTGDNDGSNRKNYTTDKSGTNGASRGSMYNDELLFTGTGSGADDDWYLTDDMACQRMSIGDDVTGNEKYSGQFYFNGFTLELLGDGLLTNFSVYDRQQLFADVSGDSQLKVSGVNHVIAVGYNGSGSFAFYFPGLDVQEDCEIKQLLTASSITLLQNRFSGTYFNIEANKTLSMGTGDIILTFRDNESFTAGLNSVITGFNIIWRSSGDFPSDNIDFSGCDITFQDSCDINYPHSFNSFSFTPLAGTGSFTLNINNNINVFKDFNITVRGSRFAYVNISSSTVNYIGGNFTHIDTGNGAAISLNSSALYIVGDINFDNTMSNTEFYMDSCNIQLKGDFLIGNISNFGSFSTGRINFSGGSIQVYDSAFPYAGDVYHSGTGALKLGSSYSGYLDCNNFYAPVGSGEINLNNQNGIFSSGSVDVRGSKFTSSGLTGTEIFIQEDFYNYGMDMEGDGLWYLTVNGTSAKARGGMSAKNSDALGGGGVQIDAADQTDNGGNVNWNFAEGSSSSSKSSSSSDSSQSSSSSSVSSSSSSSVSSSSSSSSSSSTKERSTSSQSTSSSLSTTSISSPSSMSSSSSSSSSSLSSSSTDLSTSSTSSASSSSTSSESSSSISSSISSAVYCESTRWLASPQNCEGTAMTFDEVILNNVERLYSNDCVGLTYYCEFLWTGLGFDITFTVYDYNNLNVLASGTALINLGNDTIVLSANPPFAVNGYVKVSGWQGMINAGSCEGNLAPDTFSSSSSST